MTDSHMFDVLLTTADAAEMLGVSTSRLRQFVEDDRLPAKKLGRDWLFSEHDLLAFAKRDRTVGRPRLYEVVVVPGESEAHLDRENGGLTPLCGRGVRNAAVVHKVGSDSPVQGLRWCPQCRQRAPRHILRYWDARGLAEPSKVAP